MNLIRHRDGKVISSLPLIDFHLPQSIELPDDRSIPLFWVADRLHWKQMLGEVETDFGVVLGRFYLPTPHRRFQWSWKYLVLLDKNSPSFPMTTTDTAWEEDLEQREEEAK